MASANSPASLNLPEAEVNQDFISNLPSDVINKILKCLPLATVAKMSMVSKTWRHYWLSHRYLVFDRAFWNILNDNNNVIEVSYYELQRKHNIINSILFNHIGPVHKFHLCIPECVVGLELNLSAWISFLSRIGIKKVIISNWSSFTPLPYHIFSCKELVQLSIGYYSMSRPPSVFNGFAHLRSLELEDVEFKHDICSSLIASCPRLIVLSLTECTGLKSLVIDVPSLEELYFVGIFESLVFKNVPRLSRISISLEKMRKASKAETVNAVKTISSSRELQNLYFGGEMCKLLAAGGLTNSRTLSFNHLRRLCLSAINLDEFDEYYFAFGMVRSCPLIELLEIRATSTKKSVREHKVEYNKDYKLGRLHTILVTGLTGSSAEFELIKFMLAISVVLEALSFRFDDLDPDSELMLSQAVLGLPRASSKAKLVHLAQLE